MSLIHQTEPKSPRLVIRPLVPDDAEAFAAYRNDPVVAAYQQWDLPFDYKAANTLIERMSVRELGDQGWVLRAIALPDGELLGDLALNTRGQQAELNITLCRDAQGKGYAAEAIRTVLSHAFTLLELHRVYAQVNPRHLLMVRLLEHLKFRLEGTMRKSQLHREIWSDEAIYAILKTEWLPNAEKKFATIDQKAIHQESISTSLVHSEQKNESDEQQIQYSSQLTESSSSAIFFEREKLPLKKGSLKSKDLKARSNAG